MVGCLLACSLAREGISVVVVERQSPASEWPDDEIDLRVSALTRASQRILDNLGAWEEMVRLRVSPYHGMFVWDQGGSGSIRFDAAEVAEPDLGHIVENRVTRLALWHQLEALESARLLVPDTVSRLDLERRTLLLASGRSLRARLIVAAEGVNSPLREMAEIASRGWDYDQHAIVATIRTEVDSGGVARQRFMPAGPLALLPLNDGRSSIVWSTSPAEAERLLALEETEFCSELAQASEYVLGRVEWVGPRGAFPLRLRHAERYVREGLALIGDAAHGIHPLAGQGVNLGFLDAAMLRDVVVDALATGRDPGAFAVLRRYERARKGGNLEMLAAMDLFKRLFSNDYRPMAQLRNLGLTLADRSGPLKRIVVQRAMGLSGERPSLAKRRLAPR
ncbi:MAG: UbiH/UbiF/VisC/COQ6 family ubiquinone biosynthesis hydroxylase [Gammaproteobacteria bacterium]|nr:UbiH/UbiF/VisC/COQ6 family ubiquinone biosynthesis hydroxylase [Gammaproteobacteria bacterium]